MGASLNFRGRATSSNKGSNNPLKDQKWGGRPSLQDYLKLAAVQYELDREEAENEAAPSGELMEPSGDIQPSPSDAHSADKRRRRYGFWVSAINKMGIQPYLPYQFLRH